MNQPLIDSVVHAVLYEGYILYPYRAAVKKNRQRFTFGRVYPEAYSFAENGAKPSLMQTECLIKAPPAATLEVILRFLHPMTRDIGALAAPLRKLPAPDNPDFFHVVPSLEIEGRLYPSRQEAVERSIRVPAQTLVSLRAPAKKKIPFSLPTSRTIEPILDRRQHIAGVIVRRQEAVEGYVELTAEPVDKSVFKITARIVNQSPIPPAAQDDPNEIVMRTFASTHTILHARGGEFLSLIDPPAIYSQAAAACLNIGTWPILIGNEQEKDAMVSSPIILYDYPKLTPEKRGDLFESTEIDENLTLRIMPLTREEKHAMRGTRAEDESFFNPATRLQAVSINGISLREGDLVRVRPKSRGDGKDPTLSGKIAMIESIEQDAENKTHLALVLEDEPSGNAGLRRQSGLRFFYGTDEVEPLEGE
jgi:hypothetical protein